MTKIIVLLCLSYNVAFAYLDPASGSLLLSSIVAIFASIVYFVKSSFYKLANIVNGGGAESISQK